MKQQYEEEDVDDLYDHFRCQEEGRVSQSEMYEFLKGMTWAKPPGENYQLMKCCKCCQRLNCIDGCISGIQDQLRRCTRRKAKETPMKVETTATAKKKKKEAPVQRDLLAMTSTVTEPDV